MPKKTVPEAYILAIGFGLLGFHHFYLNRKNWGVLYIFTGGLFGVGYIVDLIRLPKLVRNANFIDQDSSRDDKKGVDDAYLLWFTLGLLGFHHFYLKNYKIGILYACTIGIFGIGWIVDGFFLGLYIRQVNNNADCFDFKRDSLSPLGLTIALAISPLGIFGAHHYYLGRCGFGLTYTLTLGLCGIGYIIDWFRTPILFSRYGNNRVFIDDVYILWFFLGIFGIHHFYLGRPWWGILYALTAGGLVFGWLIDLCQLKTLVKDYNKKFEDDACEMTPDVVTAGTKYKENNQQILNDWNHRMQQSNITIVDRSTQYPPGLMYPPRGHLRDGNHRMQQSNINIVDRSTQYPPGLMYPPRGHLRDGNHWMQQNNTNIVDRSAQFPSH